MEQGHQVGALARELFPTGILVTRTPDKTASDLTQELITDPAIGTLFEAAFVAGRFTAHADILTREQGGWHVLEVKSSFSDSSSLKDLIADLAYTVFVLRRCGVLVNSASLVLLSRGFRFGDNPDRLFEIIDQTAEVNLIIATFEATADGIATVLFADPRPAPSLLSACRDCAFFETDCLGVGIAHSVLEIPGLHHTKLKRLSGAGIVDLANTPADLNLNERQEHARSAALADQLLVKPGLRAALGSIQWPCRYLDFETVATVLPIYDGHGCHRQVVTQFSMHVKDDFRAAPRHHEYLAQAEHDCERGLAEALINCAGDRGAIIVYSSFERTRITALRDAFADLASPLENILDRLTDILPIIQEYVYHPEFRGSYSIKKVLPALVPTLTYSDLEIANGDTAITRFARMARGEITGPDIVTTREHLLRYCDRDTEAMVRLHEKLAELSMAIP